MSRWGYVLLQAAVAEGALGDVPTAYSRAQVLAEMDSEALVTLARVASDFVCRLSLAIGSDWTTSSDDDGNPVDIEDRSPERRVFTRRMMAAWSPGDVETFDALLNAACADEQRRRAYLGDLFQLTSRDARTARRPPLHRRAAAEQLDPERRVKKADWNK